MKKLMTLAIGWILTASVFAVNNAHTEVVWGSASYPRLAQISDQEKLSAAIMDARIQLASRLEKNVRIKVAIEDKKLKSQILLTTALLLKENISKVIHSLQFGEQVTEVRVEFTYNPVEVSQRTAELENNRKLLKALKTISNENTEIMTVLSNLLDSNKISIGQAYQSLAIRQQLPNNKSINIEVLDLNHQVNQIILKGIASKIKKEAVTEGDKFIQRYLPALRDSYQVNYYDVTPYKDGDKAYAHIDLQFEAPCLSNGVKTKLCNMYKELPGEYHREQFNGQSVMEVLNPLYAGFGPAGVGTLRSNSVAFRLGAEQTKLLEGKGHYTKGKAQWLQRSMTTNSTIPNIMTAATMQGNLVASIYWPELDAYVERPLTEIGEINTLYSLQDLVEIPLIDIPKLAKVEVYFWISGQDLRPIVARNTIDLAYKSISDLRSKRLVAPVKVQKAVSKIVQRKREASDSYNATKWVHFPSKYNHYEDWELPLHKVYREATGPATIGTSAQVMAGPIVHPFNLQELDKSWHHIFAVYANKDIPESYGFPNDGNISSVWLNYKDYDYNKDRSLKYIYGPSTYRADSADPDFSYQRMMTTRRYEAFPKGEIMRNHSMHKQVMREGTPAEGNWGKLSVTSNK